MLWFFFLNISLIVIYRERGLLYVIWNMIGSVYFYDVNIFIWINVDGEEKVFYLLENVKMD